MVGPTAIQGEIHQSQYSFVPVACKLLTELCESQSGLRLFVPRLSTWPLGMGLPRSAWVRLKSFHTGVGRFQTSMNKWGVDFTSIYELGTVDQTEAHVILECPLHCSPEDTMKCWFWMTRLDASTITSPPPSEENSFPQEGNN